MILCCATIVYWILLYWIFCCSKDTATVISQKRFSPVICYSKDTVTDISQNRSSSVTLYVRTASSVLEFRTRFHCCLFKTLVLFWPPYLGKIVIVLDEEAKKENDVFVSEINEELKKFPGYKIDVKYEPLPSDPNVLNFDGSRKSPGYNRQLWSSFLIDKHTEDPIIAWMDTDAAFVSPVTQSTIFKEGRLRVFGEASCQYKWGWVESWAQSVERALGLPMIADFMIYFPVYVHRDTITRCREFILKRFNTTNFEEAFKRFYHTDTGYISPVSVILSYAWYCEKNRYDWNIKVNCDLETYNLRLPAQHEIQPSHVDIFSSPQTAYHIHNTKFLTTRKSLHPLSFLRNTSFCLVQTALGYGLQEVCQQFNVTSGLNNMLMLFNHDSHGDGRIKSGQTLCVGELESYCLDVLKRYIQEFADELREKNGTWDWQKFQAVAKVAESFKIICYPDMP